MYYKLILSLILLVSGCDNNVPVYGEITNVYREFKLGAPDGTTIVKLEDGRLLKYHGRLGKIGEKINIKGLTPINW